MVRLSSAERRAIENVLQTKVILGKKPRRKLHTTGFWMKTKNGIYYYVYKIRDHLYLVPEGGRLNSKLTKDAAI